MIGDRQQLETYLGSVAVRSGMRLASDTHYDANNLELSWWQARTLHRLDFQPLDSARVAVTHFEGRFRLLPRLLRWAHNTIPLFPYLARSEWQRLATLTLPIEESAIDALIAVTRNDR